jgi:hypothetical protein
MRPRTRGRARAKRRHVAARKLELTRDRATFALALLVHGALWLSAERWSEVRAKAPTASAGSASSLDALEIDVSEPPPAASPRAESERAATSAPALERAREREAARATTPSTEALLVEPHGEPPPSPVASASPFELERPIDLGLAPDGWQQALLGAPPDRAAAAPRDRRAPLVRAPTASKTGGLQEGLEARDQELGLSPAGRVASALYQAAHGEAAPVTGVARFNVTLYRSGAVEVSLADAKDQPWREVAERAAIELRRAPPKIPPQRDGYRLTLKLTAEEVLPSGTKRGQLEPSRFEARAPRFRSTDASLKELERLNPTAGVGPETENLKERRAITELPGLHRTMRGKVCSSRVGVAPLGPKDGKRVPVASLDFQGECDPVNAGAKFQRLVRTQVEAEAAF